MQCVYCTAVQAAVVGKQKAILHQVRAYVAVVDGIAMTIAVQLVERFLGCHLADVKHTMDQLIQEQFTVYLATLVQKLA